jgi:hypothetical protein
MLTAAKIQYISVDFKPINKSLKGLKVHSSRRNDNVFQT